MFTATTPPSPPRKRGRPRLTGLEQNRGPGKPLTEERRAAVEGTMNGEQLELLAAVQLWKRVNRRGYPSAHRAAGDPETARLPQSAAPRGHPGRRPGAGPLPIVNPSHTRPTTKRPPATHRRPVFENQ